MKIYIVWSCDNTEYSDMQDYAVRAFVRKDKAIAYMHHLDKIERKGLDHLKYAEYYHRITTLEVEE